MHRLTSVTQPRAVIALDELMIQPVSIRGEITIVTSENLKDDEP